MNNFALIKKWLGLEPIEIIHETFALKSDYFIKASELEAKLAEGSEVFEPDEVKIWGSKGPVEVPQFVSLAIGRQPIKKQTQAEAAIELLKEIVKEEWGTDGADGFTVRAKEVLEMEE